MKKLTMGLAIVLTACGGDQVSWDTQELSRSTALENAEYNAKQFRMKSPTYKEWGILMRGDSTIGKNCAQGDGWATVDLQAPDSTKKVSLKCSTASGTIGCLIKKDFMERPFAGEDGHCNANLPVPLPKIKV